MKHFFKYIFFVCLMIISITVRADTIVNYMTIASNIPAMSMKPDEQSQAWARSGQRMLTATDETLAQTVVAMNTVAAKQGHPVFCFPQGILFDANTVHDIILKTYSELAKTQAASLSGMTISDVLMLGMVSRYGCSPIPAGTAMEVAKEAATPMSTPMPTPMPLPEPSLGGSVQSSTSAVAQQPAAPAATLPGAPVSATTSSAVSAQPQMAMPSNPYGIPATQQVVSADSSNNPPAL